MQKLIKFPIFPHESEVKLAITCWSGYFLYAFLYCLVYQHQILGNNYAVAESVVWVATEWGSWLVITPLALKWLVLNRFRCSELGPTIVLVFVLTLTGTVGRSIINVFLGYTDIIKSAIDFVSPNLAASVITVLVWHISQKSQREVKPASAKKPGQETIYAHKGNSKVLVEIANIDYFKSAGNYLEIHSNGDDYLVRDTISSVLARLPSDLFLKAHRSFIVNIRSIERIKANNSGNATIVLQSGDEIPLSRTQKQVFDKKFRFSK